MPDTKLNPSGNVKLTRGVPEFRIVSGSQNFGLSRAHQKSGQGVSVSIRAALLDTGHTTFCARPLDVEATR